MKGNVFLKLIIFSLVLFALHFFAAKYLLPNYFIDGIYKMHLFLGLVTLTIVFLIKKITQIDQTNFAKGFMVSVVLKMLGAIVFLWPVISSKSPTKKMFVVHFFIIFFIYLITEVKLLISVIKK